MQNFMKTILSGVQTWTKGKIKESDNRYNKRIIESTADWDQNDSSADNYVKHRTHWEEKKSTYIIPEMTVTISEDAGYTTLSESCPVLTVGQTYTVILNGVTYECVARLYDEGDALIGNGEVYGEDGKGNGEPFAIDSYNDGYIYLNVATAGEYTISISEDNTVIHKLDSKYLPTNLVTTDDVQEAVDGKMDANNPAGTGSFSMNRRSDTTIGERSNAIGYNVEASGYVSTAIGYNLTANRRYTTVLGTMNIEDTDKYGTQGVTSDCDYNIRNIIHGDAYYIGTGCIFNQQTGTFTLLNPELVIVSQNNFPDGSSFYGCESSDDPQNLTYIYSKNNIYWYSSQSSGMYFEAEWRVPTTNTKTTRGKYALIVGNGKTYFSNLAYRFKRSNAHTLDWNGVGWFQGGLQVGGNAQDDGAKSVLVEGDAIPIPENATVGQTIAVKSVDENGKPVEWEATDFSASGGSGCIASDTAPEDTSVLWIDTADNSDDTLQDAVNIALAQAKESGEFKGDPGKTPEKGVDYYTDTDKTELVNAVLSALPAWTGGSY